MIQFSRLIEALDQTASSSQKVRLMAETLSSSSPEDAAWTFSFLSGRRLKSLVKRAVIREAVREASGLPDWLLDECREATGDSAEAWSLLVSGSGAESERGLAAFLREEVLPLAVLEEEEQKAKLRALWSRLDQNSCLALNKMLAGAFRVGVSQDLALRAASQALGVDVQVLAQRIMGDWEPSEEFWLSLSSVQPQDQEGRPFPFSLAHPLPSLEELGDPSLWLAEWKWDGIRAQVVRGQDQAWIWSRGEEVLNESFPEVVAWALTLPPGTALDGEVLAWKEGAPMDFAFLQRRIGRKSPSKKLLAEVPCLFLAFDILAREGEDLRARPLIERRDVLSRLGVPVSEALPVSRLEELEDLRQRAAEEGREGLMIKRLDSPYAGSRKTGVWWKWKVQPMTVDAVLVYAQTGSGRRASLYTDYTFALWKEDALLPFAKAYSGLTDEEIKEVDRIIRATTLEKHGPVRVVKPTQVFEIAFENVQLSTRHKSGVAVRFPRILRWRKDKEPEDADRLEAVLDLLEQQKAARESRKG